jgi:hypothetical protein
MLKPKKEILMNTNEPRVVGLSDLGQLTLRGNVAFAVRCARRMRPCFKLPADAPRRRLQMVAVDGAIRVAAAFCQGLPVEPGQAAAAARAAGVVADETCEFTQFAGYAAVRAAEAAANAEEVERDRSNSRVIEVVAAAFGAGRVLSANTDPSTLDLVVAALHTDLQKLLSLGHGTCEDLGPPVDPSEGGPLGPLWPAGTPAWFTPEAR